VKEYLSQKGVPFEEFNVAEDDAARERMVSRTGHMVVPTTFIDGKVVIGFERAKLDELLH